MKLFKNKRGSELVEKIIMVAFSVAMGAAVIVYTGGIIKQSKENPINYIEVENRDAYVNEKGNFKIRTLKLLRNLSRFADNETNHSGIGLKNAKEIIESENFNMKIYETYFLLSGSCGGLGDVSGTYYFSHALDYCFKTGSFTSDDGNYTMDSGSGEVKSVADFDSVFTIQLTDAKKTEYGL